MRQCINNTKNDTARQAKHLAVAKMPYPIIYYSFLKYLSYFL